MDHRNHHKLIVALLLIISNFLLVYPSLADAECAGRTEASDVATCLGNPLVSAKPHIIIGQIMRYFILGILGTFSLLMFIVGGIQLVLSGGNAERVKKGRDAMLWSIVGIVVTLSSYAIIKFILGMLT